MSDTVHLKAVATQAGLVSNQTPDRDVSIYLTGNDPPNQEPCVATAHCAEWGAFLAAFTPKRCLALLAERDALARGRDDVIGNVKLYRPSGANGQMEESTNGTAGTYMRATDIADLLLANLRDRQALEDGAAKTCAAQGARESEMQGQIEALDDERDALVEERDRLAVALRDARAYLHARQTHGTLCLACGMRGGHTTHDRWSVGICIFTRIDAALAPANGEKA